VARIVAGLSVENEIWFSWSPPKVATIYRCVISHVTTSGEPWRVRYYLTDMIWQILSYSHSGRSAA